MWRLQPQITIQSWLNSCSFCMWIRWDDAPDDVVAKQAEWVCERLIKKGSAVKPD